MFKISSEKINLENLRNQFKNELIGGLVCFEGIVRKFNQMGDSQDINFIDYEIYKKLAQSEGEKILKQAKAKFNIISAICVHRTGRVKLGETAILVMCASMHRKEAFLANQFIIDEIKKRLPIWKKFY